MSMYRAALRSTKYPTPRYDRYTRPPDDEDENLKFYEGLIVISAILNFVCLPIFMVIVYLTMDK